jgi:hypothetical protein
MSSRVGMDSFGKKTVLRTGIRQPDRPDRSLVAIPTTLLRIPQYFAKLGIFFLTNDIERQSATQTYLNYVRHFCHYRSNEVLKQTI